MPCPGAEVIWRVRPRPLDVPGCREVQGPANLPVHYPVDGKANPIVLEEAVDHPGVSP